MSDCEGIGMGYKKSLFFRDFDNFSQLLVVINKMTLYYCIISNCKEYMILCFLKRINDSW